MWQYDYRPPKPFYRRTWFISLVVVVVVLFGGAAIYLLKVKGDYEAKAAQFDLKKLEEMESSSVILDRNGVTLGRIFLENRDTIPFSDIPGTMVRAVVGAEDTRFYQHKGVDFYGMFRAAWRNYRAGGIRQGASTLTQQLARNTFALRERTYERKVLEVFLALEIERHLSKEKIVELYLNRVYFGAGFYGLEAASRGYFGKPARNLSLGECAMLAGLLKNPNNLSPWTNRQKCVAQRNFVLGRMLEQKLITQEEYQGGLAEVPAIKSRKAVHTESYAIDAIRQQVVAQVGRDSAISDGYKIYTTIDVELQKKAEETLQKRLGEIENRNGYEYQTYAKYDALFRQHGRKQAESEEMPALPGPDYLQGSIVALDNATGGILALVGGRDFSHSQFDRATLAARPAGTAFIPLVYSAAFEAGLFPGALFQDAIIDNRQVMIGGMTGILGEWGPERLDNRYEGPIPAREALVKSKNSATVRVGMQTGIDKVIAVAKGAGIQSPLRRFPATYLGSSEVTLMDMTLAYTLFPDGGMRPKKPFLITEIEERDGTVLDRAAPTKTRALKETTAYEIHSCLSDVLDRGTADKAYSDYGLKKFPLGGKTGTAYNFTDDWFLGYSSAVTCGVWVGFDKPRPIYRGAFSNEVALPIWVDLMNATFARYQPKEIAQPEAIHRFKICRSSGLLATDQCVETLTDKTSGTVMQHSTSYYEIGTEDQAPRMTCDVHGAPRAVPVNADTTTTTPNPASTPAKGQQQWPRAALAMDLTGVAPVQIKAPTITGGEDPYRSVKSPDTIQTAQAAGSPGAVVSGSAATASGTPKEIEVRRAEVARPVDQPAQTGEIKIDPPPPIEF